MIVFEIGDDDAEDGADAPALADAAPEDDESAR